MSLSITKIKGFLFDCFFNLQSAHDRELLLQTRDGHVIRDIVTHARLPREDWSRTSSLHHQDHKKPFSFTQLVPFRSFVNQGGACVLKSIQAAAAISRNNLLKIHMRTRALVCLLSYSSYHK